MAFPENILSSTPAKYQFKLVSESETVICNPEPLEWASGSLEMKRDLDSGGVFSNYMSESLTFVGTGAALLMKLFLISELNAKCTLYVYWWKAQTRAYVEFPSRFDINFNFYEIVKVGKFNFGVRVKAVNNSVQTKLDNRQDVDVDITKLVSIGGFNITELPAQLTKNLFYSEAYFAYTATLNKLDDGSSKLFRVPHSVTYTAIPINVWSSEFPETQSVPYGTDLPIASVTPFFKNSKEEHTFDINWLVRVQVTYRYVGSFPWYLQIVETDPLGAVVNVYDLAGFGGIEKEYFLTGITRLTVSKDNDLKFVIMSAGIDAFYFAHLNFQQLFITEKVVSSPEKDTEGFPVYNAIERILQHILDVQYPLYSEFFGRTDIYYKALTAYATENQLRFAHIQAGLNQRGLPLYNPSTPDVPGSSLVLNFKSLFKCLKAIWNVGYTIEILPGETEPRVRIEEYSHFFQDVEVLDISDRINKYDIQSQVMPELVPNDIKSGFESYTYLSANGRSEPNTTNQRTTVMGTASKYDNISPLRGDTKGIYDNLSTPIEENETVDTEGDSDVFIIKTQRDSVHQWKAETNENITVDNGSSVFGENLLNRYFTPSRMLIRQGNKLKAGFMKILTSVLRFQKTDKASNLETTGEGYTVVESENILISGLADPLYKPMKHSVSVLFTLSDLEVIQANPTGYITFGMSISGQIIAGYILSLKKKNNEDRADITIIERYKTYVKPVPVRTTPEPPDAIAATDITYNSFTANWLASDQATGYFLDVSESATFASFVTGYENKDMGDVLEADISGLNELTQYYYRVRAYNEIGISESSVSITLETPIAPITDVDGNVYTSVIIGDLEWMAENLKVTKYRDGTPIPNIIGNSYDDWFLPSRDELSAMYTALSAVLTWSFAWYDTSSEYNADSCYKFRKSDTTFLGMFKSLNPIRYRACRTFTATAGLYSVGDDGPAGGKIFIASGTTYYEAEIDEHEESIPWSNKDSDAIGTTGTAVGTGQANTSAIIAQSGHTNSAAKLCADYVAAGWINDTVGAYCWYDNDISNKTPYGALYNWYAVNNAHELAPAGCRVATKADFDTMIAFLSGESVAGGKLKETGTTHWDAPNTGATDLYGFSALPSGNRDVSDGRFTNKGSNIILWSSTQAVGIPTEAETLAMYNNTAAAVLASYPKGIGFSIRCVRDVI